MPDTLRGPPGGEFWMGTEEAAAHIGVNSRTLYKLVNEGLIRAYRQGRVLRFRVADLQSYLEGQMVQPGELSHLYPPGSNERPGKRRPKD